MGSLATTSSLFYRVGGPSWTVPGGGTGHSSALPHTGRTMGSGTIRGAGFSLCQSSAGLAAVAHTWWVSCCPARQNPLQADLVLAVGGIPELASVLLPQALDRLWRPVPGHWQPGAEGRWPVPAGEGARQQMAASELLSCQWLLVR